MKYRIAILEDHPLIASSLQMLLRKIDGVEEVEAFSTATAFYDAHREEPFDAAMVDLNLGDEDGRDVIKRMSRNEKSFKSIVISSHDQPKIIQSAFKLGARSYLLKTADFSVIQECIDHVVMQDMDYIPSDVQKILNDYMKGKKVYTNTNFPELSKREMEVLALISDENTTKEIAEKLHLSVYTIEGHRSNLFQKFDVKNLAGLIKKAIYAGLLD